MKLASGLNIVNLEQRRASVRLDASFAAESISFSDKLTANLRSPASGRSLFFDFAKSQQKQDAFNYERIEQVLPRDEDYIYVRFRALSKRILEGHWLDFTKGDVLKESTPLLLGATVYPNHDFFDINNWVGSVSSVAWDEDGVQAGGIPGINAEYKIDALMNARVARGLMMDPPAIHSTSMTVLFEFDFSHPDLVEQGRFWQLLGEEVEGDTVRLIVTKISEYWEASLVFQGADRLAKIETDNDDDTDFADMHADSGQLSAVSGRQEADDNSPQLKTEEKTMKLTAEKKAELGIEFDGDDVPETEIHKAAETLAARLKPFEGVDPANIAELQAKAKAGEAFIEKQRTEVTRLARLAELGAEEGELPGVVEKQITSADFDTLVELEKFYGGKVAQKFPKVARSSEENADTVETAGGIGSAQNTTAPKRKVGLH